MKTEKQPPAPLMCVCCGAEAVKSTKLIADATVLFCRSCGKVGLLGSPPANWLPIDAPGWPDRLETQAKEARRWQEFLDADIRDPRFTQIGW